MESREWEPSTVTEETVRWAYRLFLDREPESGAVVAERVQGIGSTAALRRSFLESMEFADKNPWLEALPPDLARTPIEVGVDASDEDMALLFDHTETTWRRLGTSEPYWSVLSSDQYRLTNIASNMTQFEETGRRTVDLHLELLMANGVVPSTLKTAIDFGCGVGRLTRWFSEHFDSVIACDVSEPHLRIARDLLDARGRSNVEFRRVENLASLTALPAVDLVYSMSALQHNAPPLIARMLEDLLGAVAPGGVALIQLATYRPGYVFDVGAYVAGIHTQRHDVPNIEVHLLPQHHVNRIIRDSGCLTLEILADDSAGPGFISNLFLVQRPRS